MVKVGIGDMYRIDMLDRIQYRNMIQKGNPNPNLACIKITIVDLQNRTVGLQLARRDEKLGVVLNAYYRLIRSDPTRGIIMFDDDPVKEYHTPYLVRFPPSCNPHHLVNAQFTIMWPGPEAELTYLA